MLNCHNLLHLLAQGQDHLQGVIRNVHPQKFQNHVLFKSVHSPLPLVSFGRLFKKSLFWRLAHEPLQSTLDVLKYVKAAPFTFSGIQETFSLMRPKKRMRDITHCSPENLHVHSLTLGVYIHFAEPCESRKKTAKALLAVLFVVKLWNHDSWSKSKGPHECA